MMWHVLIGHGFWIPILQQESDIYHHFTN